VSAKLHPEIARYIAEEHRRCERFYRDSKSDPANINTALMVMHADTAAIYDEGLYAQEKTEA